MEKTENLAIKEKKTPKQKVFLGLRIAGNVLFYTVIIFLFLFSLMNINAGGKNGIPNLFCLKMKWDKKYITYVMFYPTEKSYRSR